MPPSNSDMRVRDLKIRILQLLRRLEESAAGGPCASLEELDGRVRRAYLAVLAAEDGDAYIALMEDLRGLLEVGLDAAGPGPHALNP